MKNNAERKNLLNRVEELGRSVLRNALEATMVECSPWSSSTGGNLNIPRYIDSQDEEDMRLLPQISSEWFARLNWVDRGLVYFFAQPEDSSDLEFVMDFHWLFFGPFYRNAAANDLAFEGIVLISELNPGRCSEKMVSRMTIVDEKISRLWVRYHQNGCSYNHRF